MKQQTRLQNATDSLSFSQIWMDIYTHLHTPIRDTRSKSAQVQSSNLILSPLWDSIYIHVSVQQTEALKTDNCIPVQ